MPLAAVFYRIGHTFHVDRMYVYGDCKEGERWAHSMANRGQQQRWKWTPCMRDTARDPPEG